MFLCLNVFKYKDKKKGLTHFYRTVPRALSGIDVSRCDVKPIWDEIMFYNYVQFPISSARKEPTSKEFADSASAFWEVLEKYRPNIVIVWGKRLYNNLPKVGYQGADCKDIETWIYQLKNGQEVRLLPIIHPSAGFEISYWYRIMTDFISSDK